MDWRNWSVFLWSLWPSNHIKESVCKRPIHLPGIFEGTWRPPAKGSNPLSSPAAWWRNWDLTQELCWQDPVSQQESASWNCIWAGCGAGVTGIHWNSWKELGTIVSYAREPCILSTELLQTLQSLGTKRVHERSAEDVILEGEFFPTCLPLSECQAEPWDPLDAEVTAVGMKQVGGSRLRWED